MQNLDHDEVSLHVDAPPERIYEPVADVTPMPEFSPEIVRCEWLDGGAGPADGARFEAINQLPWQPHVEEPSCGGHGETGSEFALSRAGAWPAPCVALPI